MWAIWVGAVLWGVWGSPKKTLSDSELETTGMIYWFWISFPMLVVP